MLFNSPAFLFYFLPLTLGLYFLTPLKYKNLLLLLASIFFYTAAESWFVYALVGLVLANFVIGDFLAKSKPKFKIWFLLLGIGINLFPLVYYKYFNFIIGNFNLLNSLFGWSIKFNLTNYYLPLGISFFTFHALSYLIDIYNKKIKPELNPLSLGLYFFLFPHLIAGPIVRFAKIKNQIYKRKVGLEEFSQGLKRFILGIAKKAILADTLSGIADEVFAISPANMSVETAWVGLICFTLQIYLDFSSYSDMAIGLAQMFGFKFPENFNYPYLARSIQEFWQRWHMTLYNWFRDYVYIPLGGSRVSNRRIYFNILLVFALTGFWHGAGWNFIIWGMIHGFVLVLERGSWSSFLRSQNRLVSQVYTLFVVMVSWVFFRSTNLNYAIGFLKRLIFFNWPVVNEFKSINSLIDIWGTLVIILGVIISMSVFQWLPNYASGLFKKVFSFNFSKSQLIKGLLYAYLLLIFLVSIFFIAGESYKPFIYFRF